MKQGTNNHIAILLATYNGSRYLNEQIESLLTQTCQDWHLYVHDDGSQDDTVAIINGYIERYPDKMTLLDYLPQGGACRNFLSMLNKVDADYYMFCDQDDVWLPQKIELSLQEMKLRESEQSGRGVVIYTDLHITDEKLHVTYGSMWQYNGTYPQYIHTFADYGGHSAIATGCTLLFNQVAKNSIESKSPDKALMHDAWVCLCALKEGGVIYGIDKPLVLYRQHGSNCLGAGNTEAVDIGLCYRLQNIKKVIRSNRRYYAMLSSLGYGSVAKFLFSKIKYKMRIRRGFY